MAKRETINAALAENQLRRLSAALAVGSELPADLRAWLRMGIDSYFHDKGKTPLCICLDLRGRGHRSMQTRDRLRKRNQSLRDATRHLAGSSTWDNAQALHRELEAWPRRWNRLQHQPISRFNPLNFCLYRVFSYAGDLGVPSTARQLYNILMDS